MGRNLRRQGGPRSIFDVELIWTCFLIIPKISIWKKSKFDIWVFRTSNGSGTIGYGRRRPKKVVWASNMVLGLFCEPIISFSHILQFKSLIRTNYSKSVLTIVSLVPGTFKTPLLLKGPGSLVVGSGAELGISIIFWYGNIDISFSQHLENSFWITS